MMKIAMLGPIAWRIPPRHYGPWELVTSMIVNGLVKKGIDVTLFAAGDAETQAKLVATIPRALNEDPSINPKVAEFSHYLEVFSRASEFDLIHNHMNCYPLVFSEFVKTPIVTTLHGSALLENHTHILYRRFKNLPFVSISNAERTGLPELNYVATVYNGIDLSQFNFYPERGSYLVFLGRISAEKGTHLAIKVAKQAGLPLKIAAIIPPEEEEYYKREIEPQLGDDIEYVGPVRAKERDEILGHALAALHLVTVPEPFGLSIIESQATGTPVVGIGLGAVPEVIKDGETGFVVNNVEEAVKAIDRIQEIDRRSCRKWIEENFSQEKMVDGYIQAYKTILEKS